MPRRRPPRITLFLYEDRRFCDIDFNQRPELSVGIWWHDAKRLIGVLQSVSEIKTSARLIDSDLAHVSRWTTARKALACPETTEYFDIPRGRVLWDGDRHLGLVYHGNGTPAEVVEELARIFRLPRWEARRDEHYLIGAELEAFYEVD